MRTTSTAADPSTRAAATLIAGALVVPVVFWIGTDESFVGPKLIVAGGVVVLAGAQCLAAGAGPRGGWQRVDMAVALWTVLVAVSFLGSVDRGQSLWGEFAHRQGLVPALLYAATYTAGRVAMRDRHRLRMLAIAITVAATAVAAYGIAQRLGLDPLWDEIPDNRVFSTIGQTNSLGAFLALALPLAVGVAVTSPRHRRWVVAASILQAIALIATLSRGGFLGVATALALLVVFLLGARGWEWPAAAAVTVAAALAALIVVTIAPGLEPAAERIVNRQVADDEWSTGSIANHVDLWVVARHVVIDHAVLGTGPDTFPLVFGDYRDRVLDDESAARLRPFRVESPHNVVLATATGSGILAAVAQLVAWFGAVAIGVRRGWRASGAAAAAPWFAAATAIVGGLVASLFITADLTTTWLTWLLAGSIVAASVEHEGGSRATLDELSTEGNER